MVNMMSTENDFESVGYFFIVFSGLSAFIIALFVWTRWDTTKRITMKDKMRAPQFEHPWLFTTLKGHVSDVLDMDFSSNGRHLVSVSSDRSLYLWNVKDFSERNHKLHRCSVELDDASHIVFAPDSKCVLMIGCLQNDKKEGTQNYKFSHVESVEFPAIHDSDINNIGIACNGRFVMSASPDNQLVIYNIHGEVLKKIELKLNILYRACISPCGRFVGASGFTPDVLIFEGHSSGIYSFAFDQSTTRCVTASKDGTWKIYNTDVRYSQGEEAKIIASGDFEVLRNAHPESVKVSMSPSGNSFAISASRHICLYSTLQPQKEFKIMLDVHDKPISGLRMSPCGKMIASCGDRYIRIFHNVAEFYSNVILLEKAIQETREDSRRRRLEEQLDEARREFSRFPFS
ncbi:hypothetical protein DINM_007010 [Dirofilaria immitis]|nr:hypothetical protein [Dirofilaria immitis]